MGDPASLLLPAGRMIHIGPHKTGTTAVQSAFHANRDAMAEQGVYYVGKNRQPMVEVTAVTSRKPMLGDREPSMHRWEKLVREYHAAEATRVVLSSEFFADAQDDDNVREIMDTLGREHTHVVVTLRPLAKILASQWQQYIQNGLRSSYEKWLEAMFEKPPYVMPTPSFWRRHQHGRLVQRWVDQVGAENLTVVVVDDTDRRMVLRTFEQMLGLTDGTLVPEIDRLNRSLTYGEAEMLRHFNRYFKKQDWPPEVYSRLVRHGAVLEMKRRQTGDADAPVATPRWALERAVEVGAASAEAIAGCGVRVVGDLGVLGDPSLVELARPSPPARVAPEVVSRALVGAIEASGADAAEVASQQVTAPPAPARAAVGTDPEPSAADLGSTALLVAVGRRLGGRLGRRLGGRLGRRLGRRRARPTA